MAAAEQVDGWPLDANGKPMIKITMGVTEKIKTGDYANVDVGPCVATTFVPVGKPNPFTDKELDALRRAMEQLMEEVCIPVLGVQRFNVLKSIQNEVQNGASVTR